MAVEIIDEFEGIEVDHTQSTGFSAAYRGKLPAHGLIIEKTREKIMGCLLFDVLQSFAGCDDVDDPLYADIGI